VERDKKHRDPQWLETWRYSFPVREFEVETLADCADHGPFVQQSHVSEFGPRRAEERGGRYQVSTEWCRDCECELAEASQLMDDLGLSNEQWDRGGKRILAAIAFARGEGEVQVA
jgi:hypothetical protein